MAPTPDASDVLILAAEASGAAADVVATRNQYGPYTRTRVSPVQPGTGPQLDAQSAFADVSRRWSTVLTDAQRSAWSAYAAARSPSWRRTNRRRTSGRHAYIASNVARKHNGRALVDNPPADLTTPYLGFINAYLAVSAGRLRTYVTWSHPGTWATTTGAFLLVQATPIRPPTVNYLRGPWLTVDLIGPYTLPPIEVARSDLTPYAGPRRVIRARAYYPDGRITPWGTAPTYDYGKP